VVARWRQCIWHVTHASLGPPKFVPQTETASRSVEVFLHSSQQKIPIIYNGPPPLPLQNCPCAWGIWTHRGSLDPHEFTTQMTSWSVQPFLQGSWLWQTDHAILSLTVGCIEVWRTAMRPKNNNNNCSSYHGTHSHCKPLDSYNECRLSARRLLPSDQVNWLGLLLSTFTIAIYYYWWAQNMILILPSHKVQAELT